MEPCGGRHAGERSARQRQRPRPGGVPKSQQDEARGTSTGPFYSNATNRIKKPTRRSTRLGRQLEQRSCTHRRTLFPGGNLPAGSDQAPPRHTEHSAYRCYLPVLTGFTDIRCAGPSHLRHLTGPGPKRKRPRVGVRPRYSGLRVQGTATSPSSTTKLSRDLPARCCPCHVPGLAPASPPCHNGAPPTHGGYEPLASLLKRSLMMCGAAALTPPTAHSCLAAEKPGRRRPEIHTYIRETTWRRGRDSNPRGRELLPTRSPGGRLRPTQPPLRKRWRRE